MAKKSEATNVKDETERFDLEDAKISVNLITGSEKVLASYIVLYHGLELHGGHIIQGQRGSFVTYGQRYEQDSYKNMWSPANMEDRKAFNERVMDEYNHVLAIMQERTQSTVDQDGPSQEMSQEM